MYLKELVESRVRADIDRLPFNSEGYERAKSILKGEYGKISEIVNAYVRIILELPAMPSPDPKRVNAFYKTLLHNVQSLETLGKSEQVNGMARSVLDKLKGIEADLVRGEAGWQDWDLPRLVLALKKWRDINSVGEDASNVSKSRSRLYHAEEQKPRMCVYCERGDHVSPACTHLTTLDERKKFLAQKGMCFNCTGTKHRAADCNSRSRYQKCGKRHHTSICTQGDQLLTAAAAGNKERVVFPIVKKDVEGILCRALLDTGAGSSYASAVLLDKNPKRTRTREVTRIEMMLGTTTRQVELSSITVQALDSSTELKIDVTKVDRKELLIVDNPNYKKIIESYTHLQGVHMDDSDSKPHMPVPPYLGCQ